MHLPCPVPDRPGRVSIVHPGPQKAYAKSRSNHPDLERRGDPLGVPPRRRLPREFRPPHLQPRGLAGEHAGAARAVAARVSPASVHLFRRRRRLHVLERTRDRAQDRQIHSETSVGAGSPRDHALDPSSLVLHPRALRRRKKAARARVPESLRDEGLRVPLSACPCFSTGVGRSGRHRRVPERQGGVRVSLP